MGSVGFILDGSMQRACSSESRLMIHFRRRSGSGFEINEHSGGSAHGSLCDVDRRIK